MSTPGMKCYLCGWMYNRHSHLPHLSTIFKQSQVRIKAKSPVARVTRNLGQQSNFNKAIDNAIRTSGL